MFMKAILISLVIVLFTIGITSCEKYIDFDDASKESKIVLNADINPDSTFLVHLSRSLSVLDSRDLISLENGKVDVWDLEGNFVETLDHIGNGFYRGTTYPQDYGGYRIVADVEGYKSVQAVDSIPEKIVIKSIDTLGVSSQSNFEELKITIGFDDVPNKSNFYKIEVYTFQSVNGNSYGYPLAIRSDDVSLGLSGEGYYSEVFFDDVLFDGQSKELIFYVEDTRSYDDYLEVRLTSLSESAFLYEKTYRAFTASNGNPFAQPVIMYNNVENGFGILKAQQVVIKEVSF